MSDALVLREWSGQTCHLLLNRPSQGNALSAALVSALNEALDELEARQARIVVIQGTGKHFCTGFDLSKLDTEDDDRLLARFVRIELLLQRIARLPMVTVACAHGRVVGAGADLFTACRVRLAADGTSFAFPGARGFGLALGSRRLARVVGRALALEWLESGRQVYLGEARSAGLVQGEAQYIGGLCNIESIPADSGTQTVSVWVSRAIDGDALHDDASDLSTLVKSAASEGLRNRVAAYVSAAKLPRLPLDKRG